MTQQDNPPTPPPLPPLPPPPPPSTARLVVCILLALIESLLFSGVSYGIVTAIAPLLESRGVYGHLCPNSTSNATNYGCTAAQDQMTLAFTITQVVTPFGNLISGYILDRLGFRTVKAIAATLFGLGVLCFAFVQPGVDWLIFPGQITMGASGLQVLVADLQLAPMVKFPFVLASLINGLFDASAMVFSTLVIIINSGVNSHVVLLTYAGLGVATIVLTIVIYPGKHNLLVIEMEKPISSSRDDVQLEPVIINQELEPKSVPLGTLTQQLLSVDFVLMVVWMICNYLRLNYFFGSLNAYVGVITGDREQVQYYATIFGYFFLASPLISLLPGALLDLQKRFIPTLRQNTHRSYKLNTVSALALTGLIGTVDCLMLMANTTAILIPVFLVITIDRAFLYAVLGNYCISIFSPEYFGIIYSIILCFTAPFVYATVPLTKSLKETGNSNANNLILAALSFASLVHPLVLLLRNLRRQEASTGNPEAATGCPETATGCPEVATGSSEAASGCPEAATGRLKAATGCSEAATGCPEAATGGPEVIGSARSR